MCNWQAWDSASPLTSGISKILVVVRSNSLACGKYGIELEGTNAVGFGAKFCTNWCCRSNDSIVVEEAHFMELNGFPGMNLSPVILRLFFLTADAELRYCWCCFPCLSRYGVLVGIFCGVGDAYS